MHYLPAPCSVERLHKGLLWLHEESERREDDGLIVVPTNQHFIHGTLFGQLFANADARREIAKEQKLAISGKVFEIRSEHRVSIPSTVRAVLMLWPSGKGLNAAHRDARNASILLVAWTGQDSETWGRRYGAERIDGELVEDEVASPALECAPASMNRCMNVVTGLRDSNDEADYRRSR